MTLFAAFDCGAGAGLAAAATTPPTKQASTGATSNAMRGMARPPALESTTKRASRVVCCRRSFKLQFRGARCAAFHPAKARRADARTGPAESEPDAGRSPTLDLS